eukprot:4579742-Prymnesium_polylepis.1
MAPTLSPRHAHRQRYVVQIHGIFSPPRPGRVGKAHEGARRDGTAHEDPSLSKALFFSLKRNSVFMPPSEKE